MLTATPPGTVILTRYPVTIRQRLSSDIIKLVQQKGETLQGSFVVLEPGRVRSQHLFAKSKRLFEFTVEGEKRHWLLLDMRGQQIVASPERLQRM